MSLCSIVMEQHWFRSVCTSSRRTEQHWFIATMTEVVKSAFCLHTYNWEALLLMVDAKKCHWALNFNTFILGEAAIYVYTNLCLTVLYTVLYKDVETPAGDRGYYSDSASHEFRLDDMLSTSPNLSFFFSAKSGRLVPTRCTVTVACAGCLTGWRPDTKSLASLAVPAHRAWRANCCLPHLLRNLNVQVNCCVRTNVSYTCIYPQLNLTSAAFPQAM